MTALSWFDLSKVKDGTRVRFAQDWDIFPECVVPAGTLATVVNNSLNEITSEMHVLADPLEIRRALEKWDGEVYLSPFLGGGVAHLDENGEDLAWQDLSPLEVL